jgi:isopentenyl-diphosphate delta-isomerase
MSTAAAWDGSGTQEDLMYRDECILVVRRDRLGRPTP